MKTLIVFWHGIGDCVLATPALHQYKREHPNEEIHIALKKTVIESGFFNNCQYIKKQHLIPSPWNISKSYNKGKEIVMKAVKEIAKKESIKKIIVVPQDWRHGIHKLTRTARELGLKEIKNARYEIYFDKKDVKEAKEWLRKKQIKKFVFLHRKTNMPVKDLPMKEAKEFIKKKFPEHDTVEPGISYPIKNNTINFSFAIMSLAEGIVVVDSVFMHAAVALGKKIDYAYFNLRPGVDEEVKPQHIEAKIVLGPRVSKDIKGKIIWAIKKIIIKVKGIKEVV